MRRSALVTAALAALIAASCGATGGSSTSAPGPTVSASTVPTGGPQTTGGSPPTSVHPPTLTPVDLAVPSGDHYGAFATARQLDLPSGWTAELWAVVPDARMAAWTPEGALLVSQPGAGRVLELQPANHDAPTTRVLLSGLTAPQGLAFAQVQGRSVLYVAESDEIDRYPWSGGRIRGPRTVIAPHLPDADSSGGDDHRPKDVAVAPDGTVYFNVSSSSNANPDDLTMSPPRAVIMSVRPDGTDLQVVERGVRNGEGLAVAPNGAVWTAVNNRDNIPYPFAAAYGGSANAFGRVIPAYVDDHPPDEVVPVVAGRNLGWPYCNPDQDLSEPAGSLVNAPFAADSVTNPRGAHLDCSTLPPLNLGLPAHSAPLGMEFLESTSVAAPWSGGAVVAVHGSWNRQPPQPPAVLWLGWDAASGSLDSSVTIVGGFQAADGSRWGRPADAVAGPDGALYVTDDTAGAVYRIVPAG